MQKIFEVTEIKVISLRNFPPTLQINAIGNVPTQGWTKPQLLPYSYIQAPPDGIYDFDFVADPPDGIVAQVITPISASYKWQNSPPGLKGVRIHASSNSLVFLFETSQPDCSTTK